MSYRDFAVRFARTWEDGWRAHDVALLASLYAEECVHTSMPFREPHRGRAAILDYIRWSFEDERVVSVGFDEPLVDGERAAIEFRVEAEGGSLAGCVFVRFTPDGLAAETRDYWHFREAAEGPPR
ncbi:nuclear transport factor 2 family protein [Streptosporangiaceae bacterium NEAU-GS5]|nr:nuclear transport factor 2 family protein [Streptosporangiaceae bacterium NEAU-GS5]